MLSSSNVDVFSVELKPEIKHEPWIGRCKPLAVINEYQRGRVDLSDVPDQEISRQIDVERENQVELTRESVQSV